MKKLGRARRHKRIVKKVKGTSDTPRLVVFRSKKHIYAQLIDDKANKVIAGFSTLGKYFKEKGIKPNNKDAAKTAGNIFAQRVKGMGVNRISFDRAGYKYHGRVKAFAEGTKEGGLVF